MSRREAGVVAAAFPAVPLPPTSPPATPRRAAARTSRSRPNPQCCGYLIAARSSGGVRRRRSAPAAQPPAPPLPPLPSPSRRPFRHRRRVRRRDRRDGRLPVRGGLSPDPHAVARPSVPVPPGGQAPSARRQRRDEASDRRPALPRRRARRAWRPRGRRRRDGRRGERRGGCRTRDAAARSRRRQVGRHPSTSPRIGERRRHRPALPGEPAAVTDATGDDKRVAAGPGAAIPPRFVAVGVAAEHDTPSQHLPAPPIRERHAVAGGRRPSRRRPTHGRTPPRPPRPRPRRLLRPRPWEVSHDAAAGTEAASHRRPER